MSLKNEIEEKLSQALKNKEKNIYPTLRLVMSSIKDAEIANRTKENKDIQKSDITIILRKMIGKHRKLANYNSIPNIISKNLSSYSAQATKKIS